MSRFSIHLAILFSAILASSVALSNASDVSDFAAEVRAGFEKWDQNKDGQLTKLEVQTQIADPRVTGKQAAALAAIATYQDGPTGKKRALEREFILREALPTTAKEVNPPFELRYRDALLRIEKVDRVLYGPGAPTLQGIRQGFIGDCFFVAVLGACVERKPDAVKGWIQAQPDKTFRVQFPLGANSTVGMLTDGEIALTSFAGKQGMWINVMEKAFGTMMENAFPNPTNGDVIDAIAFGGTPMQTIRMMTATAPLLAVIRPVEQNAPSAGQIQGMTAKLRTILLDCQKNKWIACAGSPQTGTPPGLTPRHAYAVLGFDKATEVLQLWNPHGNHFDPIGEAGVKNGYTTRNGRFDMPLTDFVKVYWFLAYETDFSLKQ